MKKISALIIILVMLAAPMVAQAATSTGIQVVNLSSENAANITVTYYNQDGSQAYSMSDTIAAGASKTYIQAAETNLPDGFNGSVVISSNQPVAAIVNQNTTASATTGAYAGSYTGFSAGSDTFYVPVVLNGYYGWKTEISVQNAGSSAVNVTVTYDTAGCTDTASNLAVGAAVRFDNTTTCSGGLNQNGAATITATGPVVAVINQISNAGNKEQTYNGFAPTDGAGTLYTPIVLKAYYNFNSGFQVQNISNAAMDITASYSDGIPNVTKTGIAPGAAATFLQAGEAHADGFTGSAIITSSTGGAMVGIVNQAASTGKASSFNMFSGGSQNWALPSLLKAYYGFNSGFQVQNISSGNVDISVTYDDGQTASATGVASNSVATFLQAQEAHAAGWAGSAIIEATGDVVAVVNQDAPGTTDKQYSYNGVALD